MDLNKFTYFTVIIILILSLSVACKKNEKDIEQEHLSSAIDKIDVDNNVNWIVVLPGLGCHGCIQVAEAFMKDNIENKEILFVLTKISSLKILQQKIGVQVKEHPNVYIDREDIFAIPTDNSHYPCIIRLKNKKIDMHMFQSPDNKQAFSNLKAQITSKS